MKKFSFKKINWVIIVSIAMVLLPFFAIAIAYFFFGKRIYDNPSFWYSYMSYFGAVVVAAVALNQTVKSSKLSKKFDEMNAKQNYSFAELTDKIASNIKIQSGNKITLSAHHKCDSQAIILIDDDCVLTEDDDRKEITYDEYLIELCFKDVSKALIKTIVIDEKQCLCVQEPSENGLHRSDGSDTPIPLGFSSVVTTNHSNPKWIDKNEFKLQFKIYSSNNCRFSLFVNNENEFCLMFGAKIYSVCDICSEVSYKCWLKNEEGKLKICDYSTQLVDIYQEEYNNAE